GLVHPWRHRLLLHAADCVSYITPALAVFVPPGVPSLLLRPAVDESFFQPSTPDPKLRQRLGIAPSTALLVYPGGVNPINQTEVRDLYTAVARLNALGHPAALLRTGKNPPWFERSLSADERRHAHYLGFVPRLSIPGLLAAADLLVQPGRPGPFNDYRLPSKLAEFLASGRPVILPPCNVAAELVDDRHAIFLRTGDSEEITARCAELLGDPVRRARLGIEARRIARHLFDLSTQACLLAAACHERLASSPRVNWTALPPQGLDERCLFPDAPSSAELAAALVWAGHLPATPPPPSWWRRLWSR
ncbi:MAG: hypothetical protein RIQ79_1965, partial [Verrucomicrobiota bacterium]